MITPLIDDVRRVADSADTYAPLCMSVRGHQAATIEPLMQGFSDSALVLEPHSATLLMNLAQRHDLGQQYVEDQVKHLIRQARSRESI